ncbi:hypothetical protein OIE66_40010 [Nonomuraea sp. NBC_01738]|uniref:hypothetical protein n=1 Tax=Nonomuraea sp. NBC_01738 TaxID=2976003 RepID=UPI002E0FAC4A|nr:hypothetical protein OIE66_40010 [Nonomuraea sp. NBC_01738]
MTMLRRGLLAVIALGIAGAAFELATERHWQNLQQLFPWAALLLLSASWVMLALDRYHRAVAPIALAVLAISAFGIYAHLNANHAAGFMDTSWESLSPLTQWWYALTKSVGPAPPLAPGMLAQSALLVWLLTAVRERVPVASSHDEHHDDLPARS